MPPTARPGYSTPLPGNAEPRSIPYTLQPILLRRQCAHTHESVMQTICPKPKSNLVSWRMQRVCVLCPAVCEPWSRIYAANPIYLRGLGTSHTKRLVYSITSVGGEHRSR